MPKQEGQKSKLLALLRIFEQQTDEEHLLNVPQLVELLARQGILCERKSVYSDIDALNALGYDIRLRRGRSGGYWMATRPFELAELKLLVDAVQSSRVISKTSSDKLIHKLEGLASRYQGTQLQRQVYVDGRPKSDNKDLPYSVDALFAAINTGKMVRFRYKKAGRPAPYTISPWQMAWENGCYYLIAYQDEKEPVGIRHYRVDKMAGVTVLDEPRRGREQFADFDLPSYLKKHFQMFGGRSTASPCGVLLTSNRLCGSASAPRPSLCRKGRAASTLTCPSASATSSMAGSAVSAERSKWSRPPRCGTVCGS